MTYAEAEFHERNCGGCAVCRPAGTAAVVYDFINAPPHYQGAGGLDTIGVIEAFGLGFRLGNAIKYILRAGKKGDALEDLRKARWYIEREIKALEAAR